MLNRFVFLKVNCDGPQGRNIDSFGRRKRSAVAKNAELLRLVSRTKRQTSSSSSSAAAIVEEEDSSISPRRKRGSRKEEDLNLKEMFRVSADCYNATYKNNYEHTFSGVRQSG
jgi:hypothetical protein